MMRTRIPPLPESYTMETFMREARMLAFFSANYGTHRLYEQLKRRYLDQFPDHPPELYEKTLRELARLSGV